MFTGEHLGASRDNFSTNLARVMNITQRLRREHKTRDEALEQVARQAETPGAERINVVWWAREEREWSQNEHNTTLEMTFIYLVGMLDTFLGQWGQEHNLWEEGHWPPAVPEKFAEVGLMLRPDAERHLVEYRARRNVLAHRGGIADEKYCKAVGDSRFLDQRLSVDEGYLDAAVEFINYLVAATAVAKYDGPPRQEAKRDWPALIAQIFVSRTEEESGGEPSLLRG